MRVQCRIGNMDFCLSQNLGHVIQQIMGVKGMNDNRHCIAGLFCAQLTAISWACFSGSRCKIFFAVLAMDSNAFLMGNIANNVIA